MKYIPEEGLDALKHYKYRSADKSPFSKYVLQPYWNYSIRFVPLWIAPNLVTLLGMIPLTMALFFTMHYCPDMNCGNESVPRWIFYLAGIGLFWYQTLDNLDGRQARRTQTSSPLGQLFDHGVDSVIISIAGVVASAASSLGPFWTFMQIWTGAATFWFATWEEFHTGVLTLGYINGPTEGIVIVVCMLIGTGYYGPMSWLTPVKEFEFLVGMGLGNTFVANWTIGKFTMISCAIPCYITCIGNVYTVISHLNEIKKPIGPSIIHLGTYFTFMFVSIFWWFFDFDIWSQYPYTFQLSVAFAFAELTSRLILSHLCHLPYPFLQRPLLILILGTLTGLLTKGFFPLTIRMSIGFTFLFVNVVLFSHYCYCVITELCHHLNIRPLTIPYQQPHRD